MTDDECLELSDELVLVTGKRSRSLTLEQDLLPTFASPQHRQHRRAISVVAAFSADAAMVEDPSAITIIPSIEGNTVFPKTFSCHMVLGMGALDHLKKIKEIKAAFAVEFPGSVFVRGTYMKHRLIYHRAQDAGMLSKYVAFGTDPAGMWAKVVSELAQNSGV